ncbi:hypothetical protein PAXRUDRAFT_12956 [Paxillus rubicundulus Ve08.2h10]|uniref:Uncharacterized protein n=1 Tax=Paxillus rubicundulus Ve08.2h10 TaxID=930991 RepID=A0A0D0DMN3_9AGAM|nr:hypothetical protein PAXRUDRAFT_12956 [Paxillus rubicundulus Ve08.2h10]
MSGDDISCKYPFMFKGGPLLSLWLLQFILQMRLYALCNKSKKLVVFTGAIYLAEIIAMSGILLKANLEVEICLSPPEPPTPSLTLAESFISEFLIPLTIDFIENYGALGEGAGLDPPAVLGPPMLLVTEYVEGGFILRPPCLGLLTGRLAERGTWFNRVAEDEVEMVGGVDANGRGDAGLSVEAGMT